MIALNRTGERAILVEVFDGESRLVYQQQLNPLKPADVEWFAEYTGLEISEVYAILSSLSPENPKTTIDFEIPETSTDTFAVTLREIFGTSREPFPNENPADAFVAAFDYAKKNAYKEPVIAWIDEKELACLDIDYHEMTPPTFERREALVARLKPAPVFWHPSHGGGLKLFYTRTDDLSAIELASIAQYFFARIDHTSSFDRIKETRHPAFIRSRDNTLPCSTNLHFTYSTPDVSALRGMLMGEPTADDITTYLESMHWQIGQTLPHNQCPIDPSDSLKENVFIGEKGIYCHRCKARGLSGGFVSYASLIKTNPPILASILNNFVHFDHASILLAPIFRTPEPITKDIYRAMLKLVHGSNDPRVQRVFSSGKNIIRTHGQWVSKDGSTQILLNLPKFVQSLPAAQSNRDGKLFLDTSKATTLMNSGDVSTMGYHAISFIRGCRIFSHHCNVSDHFHITTRPEFRSHPPRYLGEKKRMPIDEAWGMLEDIFPKIDRRYVKLLIAAKGVSEGQTSQCTYLLISGPSGAGKSTIVHIAASICGDKVEEPLWLPDTIRFRQSLMDAARNADFLCINEIFKESTRAKLTPIQALNPLLSLTKDSRSHAMYIGSVPFGRLPVIVLTDIDLPSEVETDIQLARRFIVHRLESRTYWDRILAEKQITPGLIRNLSSDFALCCDTILSSIIDEHFQYPRPLIDIASDIGIEYSENEKVDSGHASLKLLFQLVRDAPDLNGSHLDRYNGKGWKLIDRNIDNPLLNAWNDLTDANELWGQSRIVQATDWQELLGAPMPIKCQVNPFRKRFIYIRFRDTTNNKQPIWVNGQ